MIVVGVPTKDLPSDLFGPKQRVTQENRGIGGRRRGSMPTNGAEVIGAGAPARRRAGRLQVSGRQAAHKLEAAGHADLTTRARYNPSTAATTPRRRRSRDPPGPSSWWAPSTLPSTGAPFVRTSRQTTAIVSRTSRRRGRSRRARSGQVAVPGGLKNTGRRQCRDGLFNPAWRLTRRTRGGARGAAVEGRCRA